MTPDAGRPALDVVVATRRRPGPLERLLAALASQTVPRDSFTVTVVNDGSHDAAYAGVVAAHPSVCYLSLPRREGPAAARNRGAAACTGDWLVFTDDDCAPPSDWLERLLPLLRGDAVGGRVEFAPGARLGAVGRYLRDIRFIRPLRRHDGAVICLPTANLAVRRARFEAAGGFDARFPLAGGEDLDLTCRLARDGAVLEVADSWVTYHEAPAGLAELCGRYFRYGRGEALFRRLRGSEDLPPPPSYARRAKALLGLAGKTARAGGAEELSFRLLTVMRQVSFEAGRLYGRWRG